MGVQGEEVIEDWELWGDPREVERRKADRKRAAQPLHVRQAQVWPHTHPPLDPSRPLTALAWRHLMLHSLAVTLQALA